jgi:glutaminyl-tRNA synthetase
MSKRKLMQLVQEKLVDGWDDPRMPTLSGVRRRGFTPAAIRTFWERAGITKQNSVIEFGVLEGCVREDLDASAPRRMAVLDPIKVVLVNLPPEHEETVDAPNHPQKPDMGTRKVPFSREIYIERDDFMETPPKGYFRLTPGGEVRLRFVGIVKCYEVRKDEHGHVEALHCTLDPDSRPGMPGADRKVKGTIHWVSAAHALEAEVRLYDRLFTVADPDQGGDYRDHINPLSKRVVRGFLEPTLGDAQPEQGFQFERLGYFVADKADHRADAPVFNRTVTLRDSWAKASR